jgi:hypothetical protein
MLRRDRQLLPVKPKVPIRRRLKRLVLMAAPLTLASPQLMALGLKAVVVVRVQLMQRGLIERRWCDSRNGFLASDWLPQVLRSNILHIILMPVTDDDSGGERGRHDRLTDRIDLGVLTRLVHRDLVSRSEPSTGSCPVLGWLMETWCDPSW